MDKPTNRNSIEIDLDNGALIALHDEFGVLVECKAGTLWITQLGNPHDIGLRAGQSMFIDKGRDAIVEAFASASLQLHVHGLEHSRLEMDFVHDCYELRYAKPEQVMKIKGECYIRMEGQGAKLALQRVESDLPI